MPGFTELLLLFFVAVVVFGANKIRNINVDFDQGDDQNNESD